MSTLRLMSTTVTVTTLAFAAASTACGSAAEPLGETHTAGTARPRDAQTAEQAIASRLDGLYTASINGPALRDAVPGLHIPPGTWALRIDVAGRTLRLIAPEGGDITLRLTSAGGSRLRLAPDTACESHAGRTAGSRLAWLRTDTSLRLRAVHMPCRSDATLLTSTPWRPAWPTTPLATNTQSALR